MPAKRLAIVLALLLSASPVWAQPAPYIGFAYPAGGQQGTSFQVRLGGQRIDGAQGACISGEGVTAKLVEFYRVMNNQELDVLREQMRELRPRKSWRNQDDALDKTSKEVLTNIEKRLREWVQRPASTALASIAIVEVTIARDAKPGPREIRLITAVGTTNPLVFHVGQFPETSREPMRITPVQVLGKEEQALRDRPDADVEKKITLPCVMNGQIASGEVNRYRFDARKGQRLVISAAARGLVPYIADAVPGWFQAVLELKNDRGQEVAFNDDFRFDPDPTILFQTPEDGSYVLTIRDAIYRGREDFVYRITIGELPRITSIFPLGGRVGETLSISTDGWNLRNSFLRRPSAGAEPGIHLVSAVSNGVFSNAVPLMLDTLPECLEAEPNDRPDQAQKVELPIIVNGRINRRDDGDIFSFTGKAGDTIVAEVYARRLGSPLDSMLTLVDADGRVLAINDDHEDCGEGLDTHHADSYLKIQLPADGTYFVRLGDTARNGGREYGYRLRLSAPRPDFELRVVPSGGGLRKRSSSPWLVYAIRKDGFDGDISLGLKDPPKGFFAPPARLPRGTDSTRFVVRTDLTETDEPVALVVAGLARIDGREVVHRAVPAEDRMQAFLWRHLLTCQELALTVFDPAIEREPKRVLPSLAEGAKYQPSKPPADPNRKLTRQQIRGWLRGLQRLYDEYLLTDDFYRRKLAEYESQVSE